MDLINGGLINGGLVNGWAHASAFDPTTTELYLDFDNDGTLWEDTSGTDAAEDDDGIARVDDQSGNGDNATQATALSRPTIRFNDGPNGVNKLDFDGGDSLTIPALTASRLDLHFALNIGALTDTDIRILSAKSSFAFSFRMNLGVLEMWDGATWQEIIPSVTTGDHVISVAWLSSTSAQGYLDGVAQTTRTVSSGSSALDAETTLGGKMNTDYGAFWVYPMYAVIAHSRDNAIFAAAAAHLMNKIGI